MALDLDLRPRYLFVRALEACNAGCDMCAFAFSKQPYRLTPPDFSAVLSIARSEGTRFVRFTGGEPLIHAHIVQLIREVTGATMRASIITNGALLARHLDQLVNAGLDQVIVSLDGATAATHDRIRSSTGLFERALAGLRAARSAGIHTRVNTVCGPNNFREMPRLQDLLTEIGVEQWELSSLKLERRLDYTEADIGTIDDVVQYVYVDGGAANRLVPRGKVWCGSTREERSRYFATGVTPRPDGLCHVVRRVRYLDARQQRLFPCSLLPHRPGLDDAADHLPYEATASLNSPKMIRIATWYYEHGPTECTGCSTTATDYSAALGRGDAQVDWDY